MILDVIHNDKTPRNVTQYGILENVLSGFLILKLGKCRPWRLRNLFKDPEIVDPEPV